MRITQKKSLLSKDEYTREGLGKSQYNTGNQGDVVS
jgi:hypothetical protein